MALTEQQVVDEVTVVEDGIVRVRTATVIKRDGVEINRSFHRHMLAPGDDLTGQDAKVISIANATWTDEVVNAYKASLPETP
jgi:urease accessory protein UreE|tara:strand:+ start:726 stop:971 length:246 start_codon:yes stop_codon:yes gene_type:complete